MSWAYSKQGLSRQTVQRQELGQPARSRHSPSAPRKLVRAQAANVTDAVLSEPLQNPLVYVKAFLSVASRRAGEAALDAVATVSMFTAEQPRQLQEFYQEVQAVAERDMRGGITRRSITSRSSRSSTPQGITVAGNTDIPATDLAAVVDELRADIAASRSLLQQLRTSQQQ